MNTCDVSSAYKHSIALPDALTSILFTRLKKIDVFLMCANCLIKILDSNLSRIVQMQRYARNIF